MSDDLEELRKKTERGDRNDEIRTEADSAFVDELVDAIEAVDSGERPKTVAVRDQPVAALLATLDDDDDEMAAVGNALEEALGREHSEKFDRSEIVRLAVRVGLETATPEKTEQLSDAVGRHAQQNI
ncbi:hypothetical protein [Natronococcus sp.]|uniref:hypothetical protein n=1 Tax=Natronococcus sp. TaxID=35747 RepID=UPI0025F1C37A|nr:hypothetical protein [Natronococcus sp.]